MEKLALPTTSSGGNCSTSNSISGAAASGPFPETIPEESSSNDEEHVMIFRLGSIPESEGLKEAQLFKVLIMPIHSCKFIHEFNKQNSAILLQFKLR